MCVCIYIYITLPRPLFPRTHTRTQTHSRAHAHKIGPIMRSTVILLTTYARTHTTLAHTNSLTQTHAHTHTHPHTYTLTHPHTYTETHTQRQARLCIQQWFCPPHTYTQQTYTLTNTHARTHLHTHMHTHSLSHTHGGIASSCVQQWFCPPLTHAQHIQSHMLTLSLFLCHTHRRMARLCIRQRLYSAHLTICHWFCANSRPLAWVRERCAGSTHMCVTNSMSDLNFHEPAFDVHKATRLGSWALHRSHSCVSRTQWAMKVLWTHFQGHLPGFVSAAQVTFIHICVTNSTNPLSFEKPL